jgi:hypothetical protein
MKFLKRTFAAALYFALLTVSSCGNEFSQTEGKAPSKNFDSAEATNQPSFKQGAEKTKENRKLIWRADLEFQVKNVDKSTEEINALSSKYGGFVSDMNLSNSSRRISNTITVRIPNDKFQLFVSAIKGESIYMDRADIASQDVTEEFVDIEARLKTKREVRDRYIEVLQTKTGSINDIIAAEEAIRVITEEIEAKEGRLRFLNDRIDMSTVTIMMYQKVKFTDSPERLEKDYSDEVSESFGTGWQAVKIILLGFISIWPLLFAGLIALGIWKRRRIKGWFKRS